MQYVKVYAYFYDSLTRKIISTSTAEVGGIAEFLYKWTFQKIKIFRVIAVRTPNVMQMKRVECIKYIIRADKFIIY
jgi:hypothetical protein